MKNFLVFIYGIAFIGFLLGCQTDNKTEQKAVEKIDKAQNIILLIGDGMGVTQLYAGMTVSPGELNIEQFKCIGFSKTNSASDYITDSGAGNTALATGKKTYNGAIGVNADSLPVKSILEIAEDNGYATGLISTSSITHATPASFIAHRASRHNYDGIALDFLDTDIDVFIGGGLEHFEQNDSLPNMLEVLEQRDYNVLFDMQEIEKLSSGKVAGLTAPVHNPKYTEGRGDYLPDATRKAIDLLSQNDKGFFLMVEGSQIDWGGHNNDQDYVVSELIDFDNAVGVALDYAKKHKNTLVIVTADHECGGMSINGGSLREHKVEAAFTTNHHTPVMVPVFAYGPAAGLFAGIYENTAVFDKMMEAYGFGK